MIMPLFGGSQNVRNDWWLNSPPDTLRIIRANVAAAEKTAKRHASPLKKTPERRNAVLCLSSGFTAVCLCPTVKSVFERGWRGKEGEEGEGGTERDRDGGEEGGGDWRDEQREGRISFSADLRFIRIFKSTFDSRENT